MKKFQLVLLLSIALFCLFAVGELLLHSAIYEISDGSVIALYHMVDTADSSGNGRTLTNNNGVTFSGGKLSNADGGINNTGKYLSVSSDLGFTGTSEISISAWLNASDKDNEAAVGIVDDTSDVIIGIEKGSSPFGIYGIRNRIGITYDWINAFDSSYVTGTWYHVVLNYKNDVMSMYGNGAFVASSTVSNSGGSALTSDATVLMRYPAGSCCYWSGAVDEVVILNRVLTDVEITNLYNNGAGKEVCVTEGCG